MTNATFIIRFHSKRLFNLEQTLRIMNVWHEKTIANCSLITICQDKIESKIDSSKWQEHQHFDMLLTEMQLPKITNFGVDKSKTNKIVLLDDDRILPIGYFEECFSELKEGIQITPRKMHKLSKQHTDKEILDKNYEYREEYKSSEIGCRTMWSGNVMFMKSDFMKVGGMDESFIGYGWEDTDLTMNTEKNGIKSVYKENHTELHLWHEPLTYGAADPDKLFISNGVKFCKKWNKPLPQIIREKMPKIMI